MTHETCEVRLVASPSNWIEGAAVQQLEKTATLPGMRLAVGLPDLHPGKGSPIGAAFFAEGCLYPALVGNDIGCGIGLWQTGLSARNRRLETWADRLRGLDRPWDGGSPEFLAARGIAPGPQDHALGTIGGGNHFAELQQLESVAHPDACEGLGLQPGALCLCVHSGSRGLGEAILREHVDRHGFAGLSEGTPEAAAYLARHDQARHWASANREVIATRILECLRTEGTRLLDLSHNWVERVDLAGTSGWLHRKGAAPSTQGPVVIPGSRGAFTYLVRPLHPSGKSGYSLAHGAGRKWSRSDSRGRLEKRFTARDLTRTELGSQVICEDKELLYEEAPQAYKNINVVIQDLVDAGLAEVLAILRPVITYKVRR